MSLQHAAAAAVCMLHLMSKRGIDMDLMNKLSQPRATLFFSTYILDQVIAACINLTVTPPVSTKAAEVITRNNDRETVV